jgi:hypothetical protein
MKPVYSTRKVCRNYSLPTPFPLTSFAKAGGGLSATSEADGSARRQPMTFDEQALQLRKVPSVHHVL